MSQLNKLRDNAREAIRLYREKRKRQSADTVTVDMPVRSLPDDPKYRTVFSVSGAGVKIEESPYSRIRRMVESTPPNHDDFDLSNIGG